MVIRYEPIEKNVSFLNLVHPFHTYFLLRRNAHLGFQKLNCALCTLKFLTQL